MVANPDAVKINIDGKVIVPIPALQRAVAEGLYTYDPSRATKTGKFYSGAFQQLLGYLLSFKFVESWDNPTTIKRKTELSKLSKTYAILDGPESYRLKPVESDVNFILSNDEDKFHRPVYYSAFDNVGSTSMFDVTYDQLDYVTSWSTSNPGTSPLLFRRAQIKGEGSTIEREELNKAIASTILSTDAFVAKFGFRLVNDVQQSLNDAIVQNLLKRSK